MKVLGCIFGVCAFSLLIIGGIDREVARQDYVEITKGTSNEMSVKGCLFDMNCEHYNNLIYGG